MMMLSEKTAYKAVAFAARHKWAKPLLPLTGGRPYETVRRRPSPDDDE